MKRQQISLIVLSAIDVATGILSIIFSVLAVQIIATIASGATLFKAIKVAIQSKKVTDLALKATPVLVLQVLKRVRGNKKKEQTDMSETTKVSVFSRLKTAIKNNPFTILMVIIETLLGACGGYLGVTKIVAQNWLNKPASIAVGVVILVVLYALCVIVTVYIGRDNPAFALIRKLVKEIGGDEAVKALDTAATEIETYKAAVAEEQAKEAARKAEEDAILAAAEAEEQARKEAEVKAERAAKIAAYKAAHPEIYGSVAIPVDSEQTIRIV